MKLFSCCLDARASCGSQNESLLCHCPQQKGVAFPQIKQTLLAATHPVTGQFGDTQAQSPHLNLGHLWRAFQASELHVGSAEVSAATPSQFSSLSAQPYLQTSVFLKDFPINFLYTNLWFKINSAETWPVKVSLLTCSKIGLKPKEDKLHLEPPSLSIATLLHLNGTPVLTATYLYWGRDTVSSFIEKWD